MMSLPNYTDEPPRRCFRWASPSPHPYSRCSILPFTLINLLSFSFACSPLLLRAGPVSSWGHGGSAVRLLASHRCEPGLIPGRFTPDFLKWQSCRTVPPVSGFSRGSPISPALAFRPCSPPINANCVQSPAGSLPDFRNWESCRKMPLFGGFSRGSPTSPGLAFRRRFNLLIPRKVIANHRSSKHSECYVRVFPRVARANTRASARGRKVGGKPNRPSDTAFGCALDGVYPTVTETVTVNI
ncbi:hypothetical protein PR048_016811 [Dryococelus australis]|uniref:Uncharacterized protein n=1 Tax=Dryococelus australis TaxID=614101 RepID=A0ABQ9H7R6_9NEOP|nr:hypothetical protein PR048_016811 [Dryococelus australis]